MQKNECSKRLEKNTRQRRINKTTRGGDFGKGGEMGVTSKSMEGRREGEREDIEDGEKDPWGGGDKEREEEEGAERKRRC